jgi:hypothetical protein
MRFVFSDFKTEDHTMRIFATASRTAFLVSGVISALSPSAKALDLDWHGQFRAETHTLFGYANAPQSALPPTGYSIPSNGESPASFQNLFLRLRPKAIVNDNITLHSDIWLGAPDTGIFGIDGQATRVSQVGQSRAGQATLSAQTLFAEFASDFGTVRVGRVPLHYGLGLVWNSNPNGWDRLPSNGDAISMVTKLGSFKFMPAFVKYQNANPTPPGQVGNAGNSDYVLSLTYTNEDEQMDAGIMFMRRIAGPNANVTNPFSVGGLSTSGFAYNLWDVYGKKKLGILTLKAEIPVVSGTYAGNPYSSVAGAVQAEADLGDHWKLKLNAGSANGQGNGPQTSLGTFAFHPDYRPALILFNYNLRNITQGSGTNGSPFDAGITNARFLALSADLTAGKFTHVFKGMYAMADQAADGVNQFFNTFTGAYEAGGGSAQSNDLGFELDYQLGYQWDESIRFGVDLGLLMPGKFFEYAGNAATANVNKTIFASSLNMMVRF